jgi:hypothetical protein
MLIAIKDVISIMKWNQMLFNVIDYFIIYCIIKIVLIT